MRARPVVSRSSVAAAFSAPALYLMALTTGSGWLMLLFCVLVSMFAVSAIWSFLVLRSVELEAIGPADVTAGERFTVGVRSLNGPLPARVRFVNQRGVPDDPSAPFGSLATPEGARLDGQAKCRAICERTRIEVMCGAPLGLLWWRIVRGVTFDTPLYVGPQPKAAANRAISAQRSGHPESLASSLVRGVRGYQAGDPMRAVHWAATARAGQVMVKELEHDENPVETIIVDLSGPNGEAVAAEIAWEANEALRHGRAVTMLTMEASGLVAGPVNTPSEVGRRLAKATTAPPPPGARQ